MESKPHKEGKLYKEKNGEWVKECKQDKEGERDKEDERE